MVKCVSNFVCLVPQNDTFRENWRGVSLTRVAILLTSMSLFTTQILPAPPLVLASHDNEEGVKEGNKAIHVDHEEVDKVDPLGVAPCERAKEFVRRPPSLGLSVDGEVDVGAQRANERLRRLIATHTWRLLL